MGEESNWGNTVPLTRLYVVCEGLTELTFVQDILAPHLQRYPPGRIALEPPPNLRGNSGYSKLKKLTKALLGKLSTDVLVTTMLDLYQLPRDFPGHALCEEYEDPLKRVEAMERFLSEDINDKRFLPYLQLHEFEALILTDARCLATYYPENEDGLVRLAKNIEKQYRSPEEVNRFNPPSRRIRTVVPEYQKTVFGMSAVRDLGIETIRTRCRHFHSWLQMLEAQF